MPKRNLKIENTLTGKKESFRPLNESFVTLYCCGPTVYGYTHVGNARAALSADLVVRSLEYFGYKVRFARNYTDIDDKIIVTAAKENKSCAEVSSFYAQAYEAELGMLKIREPDSKPKVSESLPEIIQLIEGLITKGMAYVAQTEHGQDVYYAVEKFKRYGCLSHRNLDDMISGVRIEVGEEKKHPGDFALWKAAKSGEPSWPSPWGAGRPGWHIECSAMIFKGFGETIDIHMGGLDLIFPHHENEIAQSEGFTNKPLARFWMHNGLLEFKNEKMSKSLGNIVRTHEFLQKRHPEVLRLLFLQQHYRSPLDFSDDNIDRAEALLERLYHALQHSLQFASAPLEGASAELVGLVDKMEDALADDFNTAKALGILFAGARICFKSQKPADWRSWGAATQLLQSVFGITLETPENFLNENRARKLKRWGLTAAESSEIDERVKERDLARASKNFAEADRLRKVLEDKGVLVMDSADGTSWTLRGK